MKIDDEMFFEITENPDDELVESLRKNLIEYYESYIKGYKEENFVIFARCKNEVIGGMKCTIFNNEVAYLSSFCIFEKFRS